MYLLEDQEEAELIDFDAIVVHIDCFHLHSGKQCMSYRRYNGP